MSPLPIKFCFHSGPVNLKSLSPLIVTLSPPDPPVIQVEAGGEHAGIQWTRTPIALNVSNGELVDFQQTFVRNVTSTEDWGLYHVTLILSSVNTTSNSILKFNVSTGIVKCMLNTMMCRKWLLMHFKIYK